MSNTKYADCGRVHMQWLNSIYLNEYTVTLLIKHSGR